MNVLAVLMLQEGRLVLASRKDNGTAHAATLVFKLRSDVDSRVPMKKIKTEGPLYEFTDFDIRVTNPFPSGNGNFMFNFPLLNLRNLALQSHPPALHHSARI